MLSSFIKKPFGFVVLSLIFKRSYSFILSPLLAAPLIAMSALFFSIFYTAFIGREKFSRGFRLKVIMYNGLLTALGYLVNIYMHLNYLGLFYNNEEVVAYMSDLGMTYKLVIIGAIFVVVAIPLYVLFEYLVLSLGNKIGLWCIKKNKQHSHGQ